jgi:hypothetical protein
LPGLLINYFTYPHRSVNHFSPFETQIDFDNRRVIIIEGGEDDSIMLTTMQDLANIVALAMEYEHEWPVVGGIKGTDSFVDQLIALGE